MGIWAGLYSPPVFDSYDALLQFARLHWPHSAQKDWQDLPAFLHVLTHKDLHLHPVIVQADKPGAAMVSEASDDCWADKQAWSGMGLPAPIRKLLDTELD